MTTTPNAVPAWATSAGFTEVGRTATELSATDIVDRLLIIETVNRYGWAYDERSVDVISETLAPDVEWTVSVAGGPLVGPYVGRDAVLDWFADDMGANGVLRRHVVSNIVFLEQRPDTAAVNAYLSLHEVKDGEAALLTSGLYRLDLVKSDGRWMFRRVFAGFDRSL